MGFENRDAAEPVVLCAVANDLEAGSIMTALEAVGIRANATGGYTAGFRAEAPGEIEIWVIQKDLEQAKRLLDAIRTGNQNIDWENVDTSAPGETE